MFGEKPLYKLSKHNLDIKNRIILHKDTQVQKNDEIVFLIDDDLTFSLYPYQLICKKLQKLNEKIEVITKEEEYNFFINRKNEILINIIDIRKVDTGNRIVIPKNIIEKYEIKKEVISKGFYDHLKIFPNEEIYKKYVKK